jgi:hypothetical protein
MKTTTLAVIAILPVAFTAKAQDCTSSFFPSKEGTKIEMTSFDKNGRETGKSVTTIVSVKKSGTGTDITLKSETTDSRNNISSMEYTAKCDGNTFSMSMKSFVPSTMQKSLSGGQMTIDANDIVTPNSLSVGQKLNDGSVTLNMAMGTMNMKTIINIINRIVTGKENITTPAGTFSCYKIEYDLVTTAMNMKINGKVKQWVAKGTGTVKSENYNDKGELMGYSELTSIK